MKKVKITEEQVKRADEQMDNGKKLSIWGRLMYRKVLKATQRRIARDTEDLFDNKSEKEKFDKALAHSLLSD